MYEDLVRSRKGMALAVVIIVMAIVSILGVVVMQISVAETRFAARDGNRMKAYYLARSGVEATTAWMLNPSNNGASLIGKTSNDATLPGVTGGTYKVSVTTKSSTELLVKATGFVNGVTADAALILNKASVGGSTPVFENTIYAEEIIILNGHTTIQGDIAAGSNIVTNGHPTVTGTSSCPIDIPAPPPIFPVDPTTASDLNISPGSTVTLDIAADEDQTIAYETLELKNATLVIKTGTTTGSAVNLVVNKLDLQNGTVKIEGERRLHLFVKTDADIDSDTNYNAPPDDPTQLIIFLANGSSAFMNANRHINGFVYGPGATVTISGNYGYTGAILAGNVVCNGTPGFNYDPSDGDPFTYDTLPVFFYTRGNWVTE